jgi:hypothetical protein
MRANDIFAIQRLNHGGNLDATIRAVDADDLAMALDALVRGDGAIRRLEIDARYIAREEGANE